MKVLSLNINNFGGSTQHFEKYKKKYNNNAWKEWDNLSKSSYVTEIFSFIQSEKSTVAILQEFDLNSNEAKCFIENMNIIGYSIVHEQTALKRPSMTVMFVRKELLYQRIDTPHTEKSARACAIHTADYIIYGTHIPPTYDKKFWDEVIEFYLMHQNEKIVLIGDFNTYKLGTEHKKRYLELIFNNAIDAWIMRGNSNSTQTEKKYGCRLDYAIMSQVMYENLNDILIVTKLMDDNVTDHAALIINI